MTRPPLRLREAITSRMKILAKLDIAEKRLPQDGRIKIKTRIQDRVKDLDYRVSVLPTIFGEKIVLRLLDKDNLMLDMTRLGFERVSLQRFEQAILKPYGMVLVTGPTGSGKTNTLYSALSRINTSDVNIITAEDPVEFNLPGINQVQMKEQIGLNFPALRSFLRQALTSSSSARSGLRDRRGRDQGGDDRAPVLSTLHTNDAPSSINRLMNMGIRAFWWHSVHGRPAVGPAGLHLLQGAGRVPPAALIEAGFSREAPLKLFRKGCERCNSTGYKAGPASQVMSIDDDIGDDPLRRRHRAAQQGDRHGMISLRGSGLEKIRNGMTSIEEVVRETVL